MKRLILLLALCFPCLSSCSSTQAARVQVTVGQLRPVLATALQTLILRGQFDASYYDLVMAVFDSLFVVAPPAAPAPTAPGGGK